MTRKQFALSVMASEQVEVVEGILAEDEECLVGGGQVEVVETTTARSCRCVRSALSRQTHSQQVIGNSSKRTTGKDLTSACYHFRVFSFMRDRDVVCLVKGKVSCDQRSPRSVPRSLSRETGAAPDQLDERRHIMCRQCSSAYSVAVKFKIKNGRESRDVGVRLLNLCILRCYPIARDEVIHKV